MDRLRFLLNRSNFPKYNLINIEESYPNIYKFVNNKSPIHLECNGLLLRKLAKDIAISLAIEFIRVNNSSYPPYYISKHNFISVYRDYVFKDDAERIECWRKGSVVIFDGIDEIENKQELNFIASFIENLIVGEKPLILISSGGLTEEVITNYNALSFGLLLLDIETINLGE